MLKEAEQKDEFEIDAESPISEGDFEALASDPSVYEVGYHLLPTLDDDGAQTAVGAIRAEIEKLGGAILAEDPVRRIPLAYEMVKKVAGKNERFTQALFVWLKCEMSSEGIEKLSHWLTENDQVLRFLAAVTVKEDTLLAGRQFIRSELKEKERRAGKEAEAEKAPLSEEELNRSLEKMMAE